MSRHGKSKGGTTKSGVRSRRLRNDKTARLIALARRLGVVAGVAVLALWLCAWIFLSGAAGRGASWAENRAYELAGTAGFTVRDILVEGRIHTDPDVLRALVNIERGDPIFAFDPRDAREMIERIAWVKEAHVERRLPHTIYIGLVEREPMALWQHKKKIRVIDSEGVTLTDKKMDAFRDLIILVGEDAPAQAPALLSLLAAEPALRQKTEAATWVGGRRWDLRLKSGLTVKLPEGDVGLALTRLMQAQQEDSLLEKDLSVIDMREEGRIIVRTRPGAVQEYRSGAVRKDESI